MKPTKKNIASPTYREIYDLIASFMRSFDQKDFDLMRRCLCSTVYCDYSSLRGDSPTELSAEDYVEKRRASVDSLRMKHVFSNLVLSNVDGDISGTCDFQIQRFSPDKYFHSFGVYTFTVRHIDGRWKIRSIVQKVHKNAGDPSIHKGVRPKR